MVLTGISTSGCFGKKGSSSDDSAARDASLLRAGSGSTGGQASITVGCGVAGSCNATDTEWSLAKSGDKNGMNASFTIDVAKVAESDAMLTFDGSLLVSNTGSAPAVIGNIVINLQKKIGGKFTTIASDISDSTRGDFATVGKVCSGASSEGAGQFSRSGASGSLNFSDPNSQTLFSLVPSFAIASGGVVTLNYSAKFNATVLGLVAGNEVRVEAIVSFGNAGARGGSGASCSKVDISGNGVLEANESYVRSVPCRTTLLIPALERSNSSVVLRDSVANMSTSGTLVLNSTPDTDIGGGVGEEILSASVTRGISRAQVSPGALGGGLTNCAQLGAASQPVCNPALSLQACATVDFDPIVTANPGGFKSGDLCTYTQGGWGAVPKGNNPGKIMTTYYSNVYPGGMVEIGIPGVTGYSLKFFSAAAITAFLPAGKTPGVLQADMSSAQSPILSTAAGVFAGQVLALQLNLDYARANITAGTMGNLANITLYGVNPALDGLRISEVLDIANRVLGGGALPEGMTVSGLNDVVDQLNQAFDNCAPSGFAQQHLVKH